MGVTILRTKTPTRKQFLAYERVRKSGYFNMIMESRAAAHAARLDLNTYHNVMLSYECLRAKYLPPDAGPTEA